MKIVLTGKMEMNRREETKRFKRYGITIQSGVNTETDFLVTGEKPGPNKINTANRLDIPKLSEDQFFDMLQEEFPEYLL